ncbi:MAG: urease, partial [Caulobacteraceae bacterium]|nr:urease [Caulobacteraceae bacterium]
MALELRPNCEACDKDLPPHAAEAMICTYECTFCADCVEGLLANVCPNCGGGFTPRPIRPRQEWRDGLSLAKRPASTVRVGLSYPVEEVRAFSDRLKGV